MLANRMKAAAAGRGELKTVTFYNDATSTGATITIPAGAPAGAIAVLAQASVNNSATIPSLVTPAGFTNISALGSTFSHGFPTNRAGRAAVAVKILDGDDEGDVLTGMNADFDGKVLVVFVPNFTPAAIVENDTDSQNVWNSNPSADTILSGAGDVPLLAMAFGKEGNATLSPDTNDLDAQSSFAGGEVGVFWSIYNEEETPANHGFDVGNPGGNNNWVASCYFEITE